MFAEIPLVNQTDSTQMQLLVGPNAPISFLCVSQGGISPEKDPRPGSHLGAVHQCTQIAAEPHKHGQSHSQSELPQIVRYLKQNVSLLPSGVPAN